MSAPRSGVGTDEAAPARRFDWLVPALALIWLPVMIWASYGAIHSSEGGSIAVATAAEALPGVVQATFTAALGAGLLAATAVRGRGAAARWTLTLAGGLVIGGLAATAVIIKYGHASGLTAVEISLVVVGGLAGVITGPNRIRPSVSAGLAGALTALVAYRVLVARNVLTHTMTWLGASETVESYLKASARVAYLNSAIAGLFAGYAAYRWLRRVDLGARFPFYQVAGAFGGFALLLCELVTRVGGANLLDVVKSISPEDRTLFDLVRPANVNNDLIVLFVGAIVALIAFGRSLDRHPDQRADQEQEASAGAEVAEVAEAGDTVAERPRTG